MGQLCIIITHMYRHTDKVWVCLRDRRGAQAITIHVKVCMEAISARCNNGASAKNSVLASLRTALYIVRLLVRALYMCPARGVPASALASACVRACMHGHVHRMRVPSDGTCDARHLREERVVSKQRQ